MLFSSIARKMRFFRQIKGVQRARGHRALRADEAYPAPLQQKLQANIQALKGSLGDGSDVKVHPFRFGPEHELSGALLFIDGLVDNPTLTDAILRPLQSWRPAGGKLPPTAALMDTLKQEALRAPGARGTRLLPELVEGCLGGDTALLVEGCGAGLLISTKGWEKRGISEPQTETVVRGPREGFTENLRTNTSLVRRKIRNGRLHVEEMPVGRKTQTGVCLMYLEGVADPEVVEMVRYRVGKLDVESVLETGYLEEYIEDAPFSPFSTVGYTEKPDVVAAKILEGRVAILVDGTPFALTAPMLFLESFQTAEDYYARSLYASLVRLIRFVAFMLAVFAPAIYIALNAFHHELIPTTLLFTIAKAREGTPFPIFLEAMIMIFAFELLREAGVRLPRPVGQAISIVGALIMGDAAVSAGLVGAPMVIAIAITAVAGFLVPSQNDSCSILRMLMTIPAAIIGFYGVGLGCLGMLIHLATLESFGVPYFDSFGQARDLQDTLARPPLWLMTRRPRQIARWDLTRGRRFIPPLRPHAAAPEDKEP